MCVEQTDRARTAAQSATCDVVSELFDNKAINTCQRGPDGLVQDMVALRALVEQELTVVVTEAAQVRRELDDAFCAFDASPVRQP